MTSKDVVRYSTLIARDRQMETVSFHFLLPSGEQVKFITNVPKDEQNLMPCGLVVGLLNGAATLEVSGRSLNF